MQSQKISLDGSKPSSIMKTIVNMNKMPNTWLTKEFDKINLSQDKIQRFQGVLSWVNQMVNKKEFVDALKEHDMSEAFLCISDYAENFLDGFKQHQEQQALSASAEAQEVVSVAAPTL